MEKDKLQTVCLIIFCIVTLLTAGALYRTAKQLRVEIQTVSAQLTKRIDSNQKRVRCVEYGVAFTQKALRIKQPIEPVTE